MSGEVDVTDYSEADADALAAAIEAALADYYGERGEGGRAAPTRVTVQARTEWNGEMHRARGGYREVRFSGVNTENVSKGAPLKSFKQKGWRAQFRKLSGTKRGRAALAAAGLSASGRTVRGWLSGKTASRANQNRISEAFENVRTQRDRGRDARSMVREFTEAIDGNAETPVRFFEGDQPIRIRFDE